MSDRRVFRWASTSARMLVGTVVAIGAVVAVVTAVAVPWPTVAREPVSIVARPDPGQTVLSCDGGLLVLGRDLLDAGSVEVAAPQTVVVGGPPDAPEIRERTLVNDDVAGAVGPDTFTAPPTGDERTDIAAAGSATASSADLAGFAASACRPPLLESWLVAGSAATGSADFVLLANPGDVAATVQLTFFGATGPITPPGGSDLVVPAGSQRVVPLAGLVRGEISPVVRVNATGAPVQASVQSSITRVLEPGGVDQSGATTTTANQQRILGVAVTEEPGEAGSSGASTVLRMLSPTAAAEATVTVRAVGSTADAAAPVTVAIDAGIPTEVGLTGLPVGEYVVEVLATAPVVAGVWQAAGFAEGSDFAWLAPSPVIGLPTHVAVPEGPSPVLTLANPGDEQVVVTVSQPDGSGAREVSVAPGSSERLPVSARDVVLLDSGGSGILAAVTMTGEGAIAGYPVWPADAAAPPVTVYP